MLVLVLMRTANVDEEATTIYYPDVTCEERYQALSCISVLELHRRLLQGSFVQTDLTNAVLTNGRSDMVSFRV